MVVCLAKGSSSSLTAVDHLGVVDSLSLTVSNPTHGTLQQADSAFSKVPSQTPSYSLDAVLIDG